MYWNPGDPFKPKEPLTITVRNARITSFAHGWVTFNDGLNVSFYLDRGSPGSGWIEAQTDLATFGANFVRNPIGPNNRAYVASQHVKKIFPKDFL
jgi:hypothetical protein